MRIIGLIRVRNESEIILDTLKHLESFCSGGIFVYDDCSTDRTVEICENFPGVRKVIPGERWDLDRERAEFENRSSLLFEAKKIANSDDWFVYIDADERIEFAWDKLEGLKPDVIGVRMKLFDFYITPEDIDKKYFERKYVGPEYRAILIAFRNLPSLSYDSSDQREVSLNSEGAILRDGYVKHYGKAISVSQWEETCDYYSTFFPKYSKKWEDRKGKAVHVCSDFNNPLILWSEIEKKGFELTAEIELSAAEANNFIKCQPDIRRIEDALPASLINASATTPMNILLATNHLFDFTGSEITILTIAQKLKQNGVPVSIFAKYVKPKFIRAFEGIASVSVRMEDLKRNRFDAAYVQHHPVALELRNNFPDLPMVLASLGVVPFLEQPPLVDLNIHRFLAISEEVRDNLIRNNIDSSKIEIFRNIVDPLKFQSTRPIRAVPKTAIVLSYKIDDPKLQIVYQACEKFGIHCRRVGEVPGAIDQKRVAEEINQADIVFSLGRGVIETMMCAKIPIVFDYQGGDGMVTIDNIHDLMTHNFSGRRYKHQYGVEDLIHVIQQYDAGSAEKLRLIALDFFNADREVNRLIKILKSAEASQCVSDCTAEKKKVSFITQLINITKEYSEAAYSCHLSPHSSVPASNGFLLGKAVKPEAVKAHERILKLMVSRGKRPEAVFALSKLVEVFPDYAPAYNDLGVLYGEAGDFDKAIAAYRKALSINPQNKMFRKNFGDFLFMVMKRPEEAVQHYEAVLHIDPKDKETLLILGNLKVVNQQLAAASDYFLRVIEMDPTNEMASKMVESLSDKETEGLFDSDKNRIFRQANILVQRGAAEKAISISKLLLELIPGDSTIYNHLGNMYWAQKNIETALFNLSRAVQLEPDRVSFLTDLADLHLAELGNVGDALRLYNAVLEKNAYDIDVMLKIGNICAVRKQFDDARYFYNRVRALDPDNLQARANLVALQELAQKSSDFTGSQFCPVCSGTAQRSIIKMGHAYYSCTNCCAVFTPAIDPKVLTTENQGNDGRHTPEMDNARLERLVNGSVFKFERVIDFGCGKGEYGKYLASKGIECLNIDQNTELRLQVISDESIDGINMVEVIEHLQDPRAYFMEFNRVLKPGGRLYIESSFVNNQDLASWDYLSPAIGHCLIHSERSLALLAENYNFSIHRLSPHCYLLIKVIKINKTVMLAADPLLQHCERADAASESPKPSKPDYRFKGQYGEAKASIIIPVFNQVEFTARCLETLYANTPIERIQEVIVVDNASSDGTGAFLEDARKRYPKLIVLSNRENLLFAKACNQAADVAGGEFLIFLNNDTEPLTGWFDCALERLVRDESIGIVGSKLLYPDGTIQHCGIQFQRNAHPDYAIWPLHRHLRAAADDPRVNIAGDVHAVTGAFLTISRALFSQIGGFEEKYGMYFEDTDLCFKTRRAGLRVFYEPASVVIHHEGKSSPSLEVIDDHNKRAAELFFERWENDLLNIELETFVEKEESNYLYLHENFWPENVNQDTIVRLQKLIRSFPESFVHFGGSGDALLLLSTFYDRNPEQTIISISNSTGMMRSLFDAFPKLKKVYFIPFPKNYSWHFISRKLFKSSKNCLGLGATPTTNRDYGEWNSGLDIFKTYGIQRRAAWAVNFEKNRFEPLQVVIQPKGSLKGMVGSKRNVINPKEWPRLLSYLEHKGIRPVIIGTPDEAAEYPCLGQAIDKRSNSFFEQMKLIAGCDFFVGADSWGKTFSALAGIQTFVFYAMRGEDLRGWKDASDFVFLYPWEKITIVHDCKEFMNFFETAVRRINLSPNDFKIRWEGSQFVNHSLAVVNRELCLCLIERGCDVSIIPYEHDEFTFSEEPRFKCIADRTGKSLSGPADVHVRHQWPPNFAFPMEGHWVMIQPWEFGSLPKEWVRQMSSHVDEVWVPSHFVRDCYIRSGMPASRVFVVPNGVNTDRFNPQIRPYTLNTLKSYKFLFVGGAIHRKGIDILLDAYAQTFSSRDDVCLVIKDMGGQTFYKGQTARERIREFQTDPNHPEIEYIDKTLNESEISGLYTACDCLVHPYRGEGFGLPIAEAMACELPVIVTGYGAALDFCNKGNSYLLTAKEIRLSEKRVGDLETVDYPWIAEPDHEELRSIMRRVIECPNEAKEKAKRARLRIETEFTWQKAADKVYHRLKEVLAKPVIRFNSELYVQKTCATNESTVSIVIRVGGRVESAKRCLQHIKKHSRVKYEVIFIIQNTNKKMLKWVKHSSQENQNCRFIENEKNLGWAKENNQGIKQSSGDFILIVDPVAEVSENWISDLLDCAAQNRQIGVVGPLSDKYGDSQGRNRFFPASGRSEPESCRSFRERNRHRRIISERISERCMLFRRGLIDEIGLIDETFDDAHYSSKDFCRRVSLAGYQNVIAGDVLINYQPGIKSADKNDQGGAVIAPKRLFDQKWCGADCIERYRNKIAVERAIRRARKFHSQGKIDKAVASQFEAIKQSPGDRNLYFTLAEMLIDWKKYEDALGILEAVPAGSANAWRLSLLGYCEEALGRDKKAQEYGEAALALDPSMALALNIMGVVAYKRGERETAEKLFKKAIESDPSFGESHTNLGSLKWAAGEHAKGLDLFEKGFILSPTIGDVVTAYYSAVVETKSFARAEPVFREALALHPNDKRIAFFMITLLITQKKHDQSMQEIEKALMQFGIDDGILSAAMEIRDMIGPIEIRPNKKRPSLSICMIVKNEELHLAKCLMCIKPVADEIIIVDTGSTDHTKAIASIFGAKVFDFPWTNDFSEARNFSLSKASGEWILVLDADEVVSPVDHDKLRKLIRNTEGNHVAYTMVTRNYTDQAGLRDWSPNEGSYIHEEAGKGWIPSPKVRLFVNDKQIRFVNPVHELVEPTLKKLRIKVKACDIPVHHYGRLNQDMVIAKGKEYYRLGIAKIEKSKGEGEYNALRELAIQAAEIGEYEEAVNVWGKALELKPNDAVAFMNMGFAFLMMKQYDKVVEYSKKAMELDPDLREAALNYSAAELIAGDVKKAISTLESVLKKHLDYPPAMGRMAAAYIIDGRKEEGLRYLDKLNAKGFDCPSMLEEQSRAFLSEGKIDQTVVLLQAAIERGIFNYKIHNMLTEHRQKIERGDPLCGPKDPFCTLPV